MLTLWLVITGVPLAALAAASPTFRRFVTLGAYAPERKPVRQWKAGRDRLARKLRRDRDNGVASSSRVGYRVRVPLIGLAHVDTRDVRQQLEDGCPPGVRILDLRRYSQASLGRSTVAEVHVLTASPTVAVRTACRMAHRAGVLPGAVHVVEDGV